MRKTIKLTILACMLYALSSAESLKREDVIYSIQRNIELTFELEKKLNSTEKKELLAKIKADVIEFGNKYLPDNLQGSDIGSLNKVLNNSV